MTAARPTFLDDLDALIVSIGRLTYTAPELPGLYDLFQDLMTASHRLADALDDRAGCRRWDEEVRAAFLLALDAAEQVDEVESAELWIRDKIWSARLVAHDLLDAMSPHVSAADRALRRALAARPPGLGWQ